MKNAAKKDNGNGNGFDFSFLNENGFSALKSNMKIFPVMEKIATNFSTGKKPLVKTFVEKKRFEVAIMIDAKSVYVYVNDTETKNAFCRKAPKIDNAEKQFRSVKGMLRHFSNKKNLAVSNILQTRICNEKVKI